MSYEVIGFIMVARKRGAVPFNAEFRTMALGFDDLPTPDMLLFDRGATLFPSINEAFKALRHTMKRAEELGHEWQDKYVYFCVDVRRP